MMLSIVWPKSALMAILLCYQIDLPTLCPHDLNLIPFYLWKNKRCGSNCISLCAEVHLTPRRSASHSALKCHFALKCHSMQISLHANLTPHRSAPHSVQKCISLHATPFTLIVHMFNRGVPIRFPVNRLSMPGGPKSRAQYTGPAIT